MKKKILLVLLFGLLFVVSGCSQSTNTPIEGAGDSAQITVMTHDSFSVSEEVIRAFEEQVQVTVQFLSAGDTGSALNKAILSKDNPLADVFYGVDNTFLSRALQEGLFEPYDSPQLDSIPETFKLDPQNRALPVDYGDVCLNYDVAYFENEEITPPQSLEDLTNETYRGLLVVQNPATSSPGLAFLLATIGHFGDPGYIDFWAQLRENDVLVVNDWNTAYNTEFSRYGGTRPIVVSYSSSPPFELIFAQEPMETLTTAAITADDTCFRQIEYVGILAGTDKRALAEKWVDFMLSVEFQEDLPMQMFVFPVNPEADLDETFVKYLDTPSNPSWVNPDDIASNRENWIETWTETVLR